MSFRLRQNSRMGRHGRRLGFERLERREVLDGTVTITAGANLVITGDNGDNSIELFIDDNGDVAFTDPVCDGDNDFNGLVTHFNFAGVVQPVSQFTPGTYCGGTLEVPGADDVSTGFMQFTDIRINMKGGNDTVILSSNLIATRNLIVTMGGGDDAVAIGDIEDAIEYGPGGIFSVWSVASLDEPNAGLRSATFNAGTGNPVTPGGVGIGGRVTVDTGVGDDSVHIAGLTGTTPIIDPPLSIFAGAGNDLVHFGKPNPASGAAATSLGRTLVALGAGENTLQANDDPGNGTNTVNIGVGPLSTVGLTVTSAGASTDVLDLADFFVNGNVLLQTGAGDDAVTITGGNFGGPAFFGPVPKPGSVGLLTINTGSGNDSVTVYDTTGVDVTVCTRLRILLGTGDDTLDLGSVTVLGPSTVNGGTGLGDLDTLTNLGGNVGIILNVGFETRQTA